MAAALVCRESPVGSLRRPLGHLIGFDEVQLAAGRCLLRESDRAFKDLRVEERLHQFVMGAVA